MSEVVEQQAEAEVTPEKVDLEKWVPVEAHLKAKKKIEAFEQAEETRRKSEMTLTKDCCPKQTKSSPKAS